MTDLEDARRRWLEERAQYEQFCQTIVDRLRLALRREGIWADVSGRAKDVDSLIRKLIKKPKYAYETIGDKSGVRIIVRYKDEVSLILAIVHRLFDCSDIDEKVDALKPDQVGYLSTHVEIRLRAADASASKFPPAAFVAELQIRTMAQHLWSEMSHDTFYKNDERATLTSGV